MLYTFMFNLLYVSLKTNKCNCKYSCCITIVEKKAQNSPVPCSGVQYKVPLMEILLMYLVTLLLTQEVRYSEFQL